MSRHMQRLKTEIAPVQKLLVNHLIYNNIASARDTRLFIEHLAFVVLNFMNIQQGLQKRLVYDAFSPDPKHHSLPKHLVRKALLYGRNAKVRYAQTNYFHLYLNTMQEFGCNMESIRMLSSQTETGLLANQSMINYLAPKSATKLVLHTMKVLADSPDHVQIAVFAYGLHEPMLVMLSQLFNRINEKLPEKMDLIRYCLSNGILIFKRPHENITAETLDLLCGENEYKWSQGAKATVDILNFRTPYLS